jgi:hypothetical protein
MQFQTIKIFPNPVTPEFMGTVGISGLATDGIVKITDIGATADCSESVVGKIAVIE